MIQYAINGDPDQTPHNVASDQGLHCLLSEWSIKTVSARKTGKNIVPLIRVGKSINGPAKFE